MENVKNGACPNLGAFFPIHKVYSILVTFETDIFIRFISKMSDNNSAGEITIIWFWKLGTFSREKLTSMSKNWYNIGYRENIVNVLKVFV